MQKLKHIIVAKVENIPGVVSRMSGFFTRRGYNIESFVTSVTDDPTVYHLTISVICSEDEAALMLHQLGRITEVIEVYDTTGKNVTTREFMLIKVICSVEKRPELSQTCELMKTKIVKISEDFFTVEVTGDSQKLDSVIKMFEHYGIMEIVRSGAICVVD